MDTIRQADTSSRPVREYLEALNAGNPVHPGEARYLSPTDPAAAWNVKEGRGKFGYFNNYLIDTEHAVIVDVEATPARLSQEIVATKAMLERVNQRHALTPGKLAADKAYGTGPFLGWLSQRSIVPHIPVLDRQHQTDGLLPREVFTFDPDRNHYLCPENKILKNSPTPADSQVNRYYAKETGCRSCPIRQKCTRGKSRCLSVSVDEPVRQQTRALQNTEPFQQSRRAQFTPKTEFFNTIERSGSVCSSPKIRRLRAETQPEQ